MTGSIGRRPKAEDDLIDIWVYVARNNARAADRVIDRIERVLSLLAEHPLIGRARPELALGLRSFPIDGRVAFYRPTDDGIDLVRVLGGAMDIQPGDVG